MKTKFNYDILALDIDDTLVPPSKVISTKNLSAIRRAQDAGVYVTIDTGRGFLASRMIWEALGIKGPVINYGGAVITDTRTGERLHETAVPPELVREVLAYAHELGIHAHIYQGDTVVYESPNVYAESYAKFLHLPRTIDPDIRTKTWHDTPKVLWIMPPERVDTLIPEVKAHFAGRLQVAKSSPGFIEFNHPDAHKGAALLHLADIMGTDISRIVAVGDNTLDYEMVRMAGLGAVVSDAKPELIKIADVVVPACAQDGVAWLIDHYILRV